MDDNVNWHHVMTVGTTLGWAPRDIYRATLPELLLSVAGYRQAQGTAAPPKGMSRGRLHELVEKYQ